ARARLRLRVGPALLDPVAQPLVRRRGAKEHRPAMRELLDDVLRSEWNEDRAAAAEQRAVQAQATSVLGTERQGVDEDVARRPAPDLERTASLGKEVAVVEHCAFGATGGARGVEDGGGALRTEWRHRRSIATGEMFERDDLDAELVHDYRARRVCNSEQRV